MNADDLRCPKRKHPRLKGYDYSQNGCYFITVCTKDRRKVLGEVVGRADLSPPIIKLSKYGSIVEELIQAIPNHYEYVSLHKYVVMPNHIHILLMIDRPDDGGLRSARPTVQTIIHALKALVSKRVGGSIWQNGFHDHIIRDEADYLNHWQYIDTNPAKWSEDEYYIK